MLYLAAVPAQRMLSAVSPMGTGAASPLLLPLSPGPWHQRLPQSLLVLSLQGFVPWREQLSAPGFGGGGVDPLRGRTGRKEAPLMPCSCSARATHLSDPGSGFTHVVLVFVGTGHRGKEAGVWLAGSFQQSPHPAAAAGSLACITDPLCLRAV